MIWSDLFIYLCAMGIAGCLFALCAGVDEFKRKRSK